LGKFSVLTINISAAAECHSVAGSMSTWVFLSIAMQKRRLRTAAERSFRSDISYDSLPTLFDFNPLDANDLRTAVPKAAHRLNLGGKRMQQPSSGRRHYGHVPVAAVSAASPAQDRHRDGVRASHLYRQGRFDLVFLKLFRKTLVDPAIAALTKGHNR
jgi:hypothetical protein